MWFLVIFLVVVIIAGGLFLLEEHQAKNRFKNHCQTLQNEIVVAGVTQSAQNDKISGLEAQVEDLKNQRDSVNHMVKLGLLTVVEHADIKKQLRPDDEEEDPKAPSDDDNVIYIGRHA